MPSLGKRGIGNTPSAMRKEFVTSSNVAVIRENGNPSLQSEVPTGNSFVGSLNTGYDLIELPSNGRILPYARSASLSIANSSRRDASFPHQYELFTIHSRFCGNRAICFRRC